MNYELGIMNKQPLCVLERLCDSRVKNYKLQLQLRRPQ